MNYKPSYQGELIDPATPPSAAAMHVLEDVAESPQTVAPERPASAAPAVVEEDPAARPAFEFLDLDEPMTLGGSESVQPSGQAVTTDLGSCDAHTEPLFVDLDSQAGEESTMAASTGEVESLQAEPVATGALPAQTPAVEKPQVRRPSLAVRGVEDANRAPRRVAMQQAINSWTVASGVLKMIIMHPGYTSSLDDKLAGIEVTRHALDQAALKLEEALGFPKNEGSRQKAKRHLLPVMESVWGYLFSQAPTDVDIDQVVGFATKFLAESADLLSADPDELFLRSDRSLDLAMARLTAMTRVQCELQPIFDVIDKYSQKNAAISKIFFGDMNRRAVLDDVYRLVEEVANSFEEGIDFSHLGDNDKTIVRRVVLRQSVDLMSGILRSETVMAKLSAFAKETPKKEGVLKDWITSQYAEWTEGMPSLAAMVEAQVREQGLSEPRKIPNFS